MFHMILITPVHSATKSYCYDFIDTDSKFQAHLVMELIFRKQGLVFYFFLRK